jgi:hypothetical protein
MDVSSKRLRELDFGVGRDNNQGGRASIDRFGRLALALDASRSGPTT